MKSCSDYFVPIPIVNKINVHTLAPANADAAQARCVCPQWRPVQLTAMTHVHAVLLICANLPQIRLPLTHGLRAHIYVPDRSLVPYETINLANSITDKFKSKHLQNVQLHLASQQSILFVDQCEPL